jgi:hypothetical protein
LSRIAIVASHRYAINANDFYMFFAQSEHDVVGVFLHQDTKSLPWFKRQAKPDRARSDCFMPFDLDLLTWWGDERALMRELTALGADYICMGNGSDPLGQLLCENFPGERLLFSEYGWFPWNQCFYISRYGTATESELARMTMKEIDSLPMNAEEICAGADMVRDAMRGHGDVPVCDEGYVYVPLQVDVGDFKFGLTEFENNSEFLDFIDRMIPADQEIWVRNHPLNKMPIDVSSWKRFRDISGIEFNKHELYSAMSSMVVINSTSALEALAYHKPVFVYGDDVFTGKGICWENVTEPSVFVECSKAARDSARSDRFLALMKRYQVNRLSCLREGVDYVRRHYWNNCL